MLSRRSAIAVAVLLLLVLGMFVYAGSLDPPSRLKSRPATATSAVKR